MKIKKRISEFHFLLFPPFFWLGLFFIIPLIIIVVYSFGYQKTYGGVELGFTFDNYLKVFDPVYISILIRSFGYALFATIITFLFAYPISYYMAFSKPRTKNILMFLVILPFWTNLLVRLYSFLIILGDSGLINSFLITIGIIEKPLNLMNNSFSVMVGLVYWNLPFMILPIFASLDKMDVSLYEASMDLGANRMNTFLRIIFPVSIPGIVAGIVFVFVPTLGNFIVPDILGGTENYIIGNVITSQFLRARNWPLGSSFSVVLIFLVMFFVAFYIRYYDPSKSQRLKEN